MARIKLGPAITDIAGSVGGTTFQRSRFGIPIRTKPLPLKSETPAQLKKRRLIASLQGSGQALTAAERLQWDRYIDFSGQTIRRDKSVLTSGQALYINYQLFNLLYNRPLLTDLAYIPMPAYNPLEGIGVDAGNYYLDFSGLITHTVYFFLCKLTAPRHQSQAFNPRGLRFMWVVMSTNSMFTINQMYIEAFGALPPIGSYVHCTIRYFSVLAPVFTSPFRRVLEVYEA